MDDDVSDMSINWFVYLNTFCLANGPLRARALVRLYTNVGWVLDSAWPALGKSEAGATRPQLLGPTQLAYMSEWT